MNRTEPLFAVIQGPAARRSLWPYGKTVPAGWAIVAGARTKRACADFLESKADIRKTPLKFGLMFFGGNESSSADKPYELLLRGAKFADENGFAAVWLPERHFAAIGSLYPNPAVLHAALAVTTKRVRLRAGSVVLPLHHPARIAEEWAVVDQLSGGRVELSFAPGWNSQDFALAPGTFADRYRTLEEGVETVRNLWEGNAVAMPDGDGHPVEIRTYPRPVQPSLPVWLTIANSVKNFETAGRIGANVLTHLFEHDAAELGGKIAAYRAARAAHGLDPAAGRVAAALHTFVCDDPETLRRRAEEPYCEYLRSNVGLLKRFAAARKIPIDPTRLSPADLRGIAAMLYEKFLKGRSLIGSLADCRKTAAVVAAAGVDEIACLVDFGPRPEHSLESLAALGELAAGFAPS